MARIAKLGKEDARTIAMARKALNAAYIDAKNGEVPFLIIRDGYYYEVRAGKLTKKGKAPAKVAAPLLRQAVFKLRPAAETDSEPVARKVRKAAKV